MGLSRGVRYCSSNETACDGNGVGVDAIVGAGYAIYDGEDERRWRVAE